MNLDQHLGRRRHFASAIAIAISLNFGLGAPPAWRHGNPPSTQHAYYVSASARPDGIGTLERPWTLTAALDGGGGTLQPGDTVWLRGGTYRGVFRTALEGAPGRWIVFRQRPGERATIDGTLRADGAYLAFWGFEVMQSTPSTYGLEANTNYGRFINLVVHDAGSQGITFWTPGIDAELYGCIVYNNGTHPVLDHGVYVHNEEGTKLLADNVFFDNLANGIQVYASHKNPAIRNVRVEGNVSFNNGTISPAGRALANLVVNAQVPTEGMVVADNMLYYSGADGVNLSLGTNAAANNRDVVVQDNYAVGGWMGLEMGNPWRRATVTGNTFVASHYLVNLGGVGLAVAYQWSGNTWGSESSDHSWRFDHQQLDWNAWREATGLGGTDGILADSGEPRVFVRPNRYEAGRAHVIVYNWGRLAEVPVDVSRVLRPGDRFEVRNVQALFGAPVASGVYQGTPIPVPMDGVEPPAPIGRPTRPPPRTGPAFDVFLLTSESP
jgi:hypothetical protein